MITKKVGAACLWFMYVVWYAQALKCINVPVYGSVECEAATTKECVGGRTVFMTKFSNGVPAVETYDNAGYCHCKDGWTGIGCEQPCPTIAATPEERPVACNNRHVQLPHITETCGQVFRHLPPNVKRETWLENVPYLAIPGLCSCEWPYLGIACDWKVNIDKSRHAPAWDDFRMRKGRLTGRNNAIVDPVFFKADTAAPREMEICGENGRFNDGKCECGPGWFPVPVTDIGDRYMRGKADGGSGLRLPDDDRTGKRWLFSQLPICAIANNGDVLGLDLNRDGQTPASAIEPQHNSSHTVPATDTTLRAWIDWLQQYGAAISHGPQTRERDEDLVTIMACTSPPPTDPSVLDKCIAFAKKRGYPRSLGSVGGPGTVMSDVPDVLMHNSTFPYAMPASFTPVYGSVIAAAVVFVICALCCSGLLYWSLNADFDSLPTTTGKRDY